MSNGLLDPPSSRTSRADLIMFRACQSAFSPLLPGRMPTGPVILGTLPVSAFPLMFLLAINAWRAMTSS